MFRIHDTKDDEIYGPFDLSDVGCGRGGLKWLPGEGQIIYIDEIGDRFKIMLSYKEAWIDLIKSLDGQIDGVSFAVERGHNAQRELDQLLEVQETVKEIAEKYGVEGSIYDIEEVKDGSEADNGP